MFHFKVSLGKFFRQRFGYTVPSLSECINKWNGVVIRLLNQMYSYSKSESTAKTNIALRREKK